MMLNSRETQQVAAELVEKYGSITPGAAMRYAREAEQRNDLIVMTEWLRIAHEALRQLPTEVLFS